MNINTFNAFKSRNYRLFFSGQCVSLIGTWMQKTAVSWVVYAETHSEMMLGVTLFASMFPTFLLSFLGGIAADRMDRYKLLVQTQVASMIQAILLTALIFFRHYYVWEIIALSAVLGIINAFDVPARQSLIYELVDDKKDLPNALALNSSMVNLSRLIGPGIAGIALEKLGYVSCFGMNAISFIAVIASLMMMRLPKYTPTQSTKNVLGDIKEGLQYVRSTPRIALVIAMLALTSLLVMPFSTLMPVYAKDIFKGTATTFGAIDSFIGLGAFASALFLASIKPSRNLMTILVINTVVFGLGLVLFSHESNYRIALLFITIAGFGMMSQMTISNTLIQTTVDHSMRGRVISLYAMAFFGMQPLGGLLIGSVTHLIGTPNTVLAEGIITIIIAVLLFLIIRNKKETAVPEPATIAVQETVE